MGIRLSVRCWNFINIHIKGLDIVAVNLFFYIDCFPCSRTDKHTGQFLAVPVGTDVIIHSGCCTRGNQVLLYQCTEQIEGNRCFSFIHSHFRMLFIENAASPAHQEGVIYRV